MAHFEHAFASTPCETVYTAVCLLDKPHVTVLHEIHRHNNAYPEAALRERNRWVENALANILPFSQHSHVKRYANYSQRCEFLTGKT